MFLRDRPAQISSVNQGIGIRRQDQQVHIATGGSRLQSIGRDGQTPHRLNVGIKGGIQIPSPATQVNFATTIHQKGRQRQGRPGRLGDPVQERQAHRSGPIKTVQKGAVLLYIMFGTRLKPTGSTLINVPHADTRHINMPAVIPFQEKILIVRRGPAIGQRNQLGLAKGRIAGPHHHDISVRLSVVAQVITPGMVRKKSGLAKGRTGHKDRIAATGLDSIGCVHAPTPQIG